MEIRFERPDGEQGGGYLAEPAGGEDAPGVVVVHEWWGVNEQIRAVADRLAQRGYRALAVDLFGGRLAKDTQEASELRTTLDDVAAVEQDVRGAVSYLQRKAPGVKVAVLGFCMGGRMAQLASVRVPEIAAAVSFYGNPKPPAVDLGQAKAPLLLHFATDDEFIPQESVTDAEAELLAGGVPHELHWYEAQHAFANERRPEVYDAAAAQLAWERTNAFLDRTLR